MELLIFVIGVALAIWTPLTLTTCSVLVAVVVLTIWGIRLYHAPMTWAEGKTWLLTFAAMGAASAVGWWWGGGRGGIDVSYVWLSAVTGLLGAMAGLFAERRRARKGMIPA